jgi:hypothetical protein
MSVTTWTVRFPAPVATLEPDILGGLEGIHIYVGYLNPEIIRTRQVGKPSYQDCL